MGLEEQFETGFLDKLPAWNNAIAKHLRPFEPFIDVLLLVTAGLCIWSIVWKRPQYKLLWLAFLWSP